MNTEDIILSKLQELKCIGYDITDDNRDNIINGFIDIWNSMILDFMPEEAHKEIKKAIEEEDDFIRWYMASQNRFMQMIPWNRLNYLKIDENDSDEERERKIYLNHLKYIKKFLKWFKHRVIAPETTEVLEKIKKKILESKELKNDFHKGVLSKEEEKLLIELLEL